MTFLELAKRTAAETGVDLTDDEAATILWEHTGFPDFFHGRTPADVERECADQIRAHLEAR